MSIPLSDNDQAIEDNYYQDSQVQKPLFNNFRTDMPDLYGLLHGYVVVLPPEHSS